jgi:hypothetical protein
MRVIAIVKYVFTAVGILILGLAAYFYLDARSFVAESIETDGTVVRLDPVRSDNGTTYRPTVAFRTAQGEEIEFTSSTSSNPPAYARGESVRVLYRPAEPHSARINSYLFLWGASTAMTFLGGIFLAIGGGIILWTRVKRGRDDELRRSGVPIETEFQTVELNESLTVNGRHPFRVVTQWHNPATAKVHVFTSNNLWFNPTEYIKAKNITVYIERNNPKKYYVDLSFLPELAS